MLLTAAVGFSLLALHALTKADEAKITALMRAVRHADGLPETIEEEEEPADRPPPIAHPVVRNPLTGDTVTERR